MRRLMWLLLPVVVGAELIGACAPRQFTTVTIYDTPAAYVRLEFDRTVKQGAEHSHPISLSPEKVAAALSGVRIEEPIPLVRGDIVQRESVPRVHPAFTDEYIAFLAPLLALALSKATQEEVVTFYDSRYRSGTSREVTSGGLFVHGDELHLILANYRSPTHFMADVGNVDTQDDRLTPMQSLSPQGGHLDFEPHSAKRERTVGVVERFFQWDRRELTVLYKQLPSRPLVALPPKPVAAP